MIKYDSNLGQYVLKRTITFYIPEYSVKNGINEGNLDIILNSLKQKNIREFKDFNK